MFRNLFILGFICFLFSACSETDNTTEPSDTTQPANVTDLRAVPDDGKATLSWTDPIDADFDHVEITFTPEVAEMSQPITVLKDIQTESILGLTNGETYTFTVFSVDSSNYKSDGVTVQALIGIPPVDVTELKAYPNDGRIRLRWIDPVDADFDHVEIFFNPEIADSTQPLIILKEEETVMISGLTNSINYTFTVFSIDSSNLRSSGVMISETPNPIPITEGDWSNEAGTVTFTVTGDKLTGRKSVKFNVYDYNNHFYPYYWYTTSLISIDDNKFYYSNGNSVNDVGGRITFNGTFFGSSRCSGYADYEEHSIVTNGKANTVVWTAEPVVSDSSSTL